MLKMTNDTYGHEAGNQLLVSASRLICSTFKRSPVFRIGGDEFLVILENDDFENRFDLMNEINEKYHENPDMVANNQVAVTVACGISDFILGADSSFEDVVNKADAAMYARKQQMKRNLEEKVQV
jgi:diguanylate cyclase (GGDEF)-like protein